MSVVDDIMCVGDDIMCVVVAEWLCLWKMAWNPGSIPISDINFLIFIRDEKT